MDQEFSQWRKKYKKLSDYYKKEFNTEYYEFDKYELEIDPDESVEDIEKYDATRQRIEITKCALSFPYFCTKYVKILHPKKGLIPFLLYKYQRFTIKEYEKNRFNIIRKFRQGGLTTVTEIWGMWRCLFKLDQQIMFLSKTDREAIAAGEIINKATLNLPKWMKPSPDGKWNDHHKAFQETGGNMYFFTPEAARGRAITYLILDEAAFIPAMEEHWKAMYPTLSTGGNCIVISTVNGLGNWYADTYHGALDKKNDFNIIDLKYTQHPEYHNDKWVRDQKAQLGEKGWQQEVLGSFLGSGNTYVPMHIIGELQESTRYNLPKRKRFQKWSNLGDANERADENFDRDGALWIWKEAQDNHEYILGVDSAEGVGDDGDNSCIQVFDTATLEQVAEFYSNLVPPYIFAQIVKELGIYYNTGLVVVETNGPGGAVLSNLQYELFYENLYFDSTKSIKNAKAGFKTTMANRPIILEAMQHRLMNGTIRINSRRFVKELNTFRYNPQTQKAEAQKNKHDDAIIALCLAIYIRDSFLRDVPMGAETPQELASPYKHTIYEEIKKEIMEGSPKDFLKKDAVLLPDEDDMLSGVVFNFRRKNDKLFREFGWAINPFILTCYEIIDKFFSLVGSLL